MKRPTKLEYILESDDNHHGITVSIEIDNKTAIFRDMETSLHISLDQLSELSEVINDVRKVTGIDDARLSDGLPHPDEATFRSIAASTTPPGKVMTYAEIRQEQEEKAAMQQAQVQASPPPPSSLLDNYRKMADAVNNLFIIGSNGTYLNKSRTALGASLRETVLIEDPVVAHDLANRLNAQAFPYHLIGGYRVAVINPYDNSVVYWTRNGAPMVARASEAPVFYGRVQANEVLALAEVPKDCEKALIPAAS